MEKLENSQIVINAKGWEEICKPYLETMFLTVAYRGEVTYDEEKHEWTYDKKRRVNDDKIGYFGSVLTQSGKHLKEFWSVSKAQKMASEMSKMYNEQKGVWYENFDTVTLKKLESVILMRLYDNEIKQ